ncbi:MAG TPA: TetR/AcrR family transcriptional regulator [Ktedonobacteraceae bacterium]|nr:TetR/AcrR family transcriptional regulator [Ktedonobacteraceae bacterium]
MTSDHTQTSGSPLRDKKAVRPRNAKETRAALLACARLRFARDGYETTNLRDIATDAGVSVALIPRYFGSKEGLFQAVIAFDRQRVAEAMQGPLEGLGERLLEGILIDPPDSEHDLFVTLLRSSDYLPAREYLQKLLATLETDLARLSPAPDAELRASIITALITGIVVLRRQVGKPPLSEASTSALLPHFQRVLSTLLLDGATLNHSEG